MNRQEKLDDIKLHPEKHRHTFDVLQSCCMLDGALSLELMEAHEGIVDGTRGNCDVISGPCSCGATH